jgi:sulfopyruvate decarboxylase TPP-binding subunit
MQSSGVGNIVNALSLPAVCRIPCLMLVTMRGQWGEFNGWQVPMGRNAETVMTAMGVTCYRVHDANAIGETVAAAVDFAFNASVAAAVLIGQQVIGAKTFGADEETP